MKRKLVHIEWHDAVNGFVEEWTDLDDIEFNPQLVESVGWVHSETGDIIILVHNIAETDNQGFSAVCIPKGMIQKITTLKMPGN